MRGARSFLALHTEPGGEVRRFHALLLVTCARPSVEQMASAQRGHDYLVLPKIGCPLTFLVISVSDDQTETAANFKHCFADKALFEMF